MLTCREVREYMNSAGARLDSLGDLPPEVSSHLTSCTSCLADRRVAWLRKRDVPVAAVANPPVRRGRLLWLLGALVAVLAAALFVLSRNGFFRQP